MQVRLELMDDEAAEPSPLIVIVYRIERLSVNQPMDRATFQIPWERADRVWDDERQIFVKRHTDPRARDDQDKPH